MLDVLFLYSWRMLINLLTSLTISCVITAAVIKVTEAAVSGKGVHNTCRTYSMDKRCFSVCCERNF